MSQSEVIFKSNIVWLDVDEIKPNDYNPNYMPQTTFEALVKSIKKGFYGAIVISKDKIIIDGEHRWRALKLLGQKKIPCIYEENADLAQMKILTIQLNRERGYLTPVETGNVLSSLNTEHQIPMDILVETTHIPMEEMTVLTNLKFDPDLVQDDKDENIYTWSKIDGIVGVLTGKLRERGMSFDTIYYKSRGGLVPARLIADRLDIKEVIEFDSRSSPTKQLPVKSLIVEDIYDTGKTYKDLKEIFNEDTIFACLFMRREKSVPRNVVFGTLTQGNEYIVFPWDKMEYRRSLKAK